MLHQRITHAFLHQIHANRHNTRQDEICFLLLRPAWDARSVKAVFPCLFTNTAHCQPSIMLAYFAELGTSRIGKGVQWAGSNRGVKQGWNVKMTA